mmetsp:Transcript_82852/g.238045  ORF Transcript_82852/g.238045 Transcript_82852/m.238045 type:complete len:204 (+) Transcript_82852:91-702(+)
MGEAPLPNVRVGVAALLLRTRPGVHGVSEVSDVETLVGTRKGSHGAGTLALPGGHLEPREGWAETAARELAEETGLDTPLDAWRVAFVSNDVMQDGRKHYVTIFMECDVRLLPGGLEGLPAPRNLEPDKCEGWSWMSLASLQAVDEQRLFLPMIHFLRAAADGRYRPLRGVEEVHSGGSNDEEKNAQEPSSKRSRVEGGEAAK